MSPRPVADTAPTATAQGAGSHCKSASRLPRVLRRSRYVRTRGEAGFLMRSAKPRPRRPITRAAVTGGSSGPAEGAIRCGTDTRTSAGSVTPTPDRPRSTRRHVGSTAAPAHTSSGANGRSRGCSRSASRIAAARPSFRGNQGSPQRPERLAPQPDHRSTAPATCTALQLLPSP